MKEKREMLQKSISEKKTLIEEKKQAVESWDGNLVGSNVIELVK